MTAALAHIAAALAARFIGSNGTAGHPHVTRLLCGMAGGIFVPLPPADGDVDALGGLMLTLAVELGDVSAEIRNALADDGRVTGGEAERVLSELDDLDRASARLRMVLGEIARGLTTEPKQGSDCA